MSITSVWYNRIRKFRDNPKAIFPFLRKKLYYNFIADSYLKHYKEFKYYTYEETLNHIMKNNVSIVRFGDELFDMLQGIGLYYGNWRQKYSKELASRMEEILVNKHERLLVCFNPELILKTKEEFLKEGIPEQHEFWTHSKIFLKDYYHKDTWYGSALCFTPRYNKNINFKRLQEYFLTKDVVIITSRIDRFKDLTLGKNTYFIEAPASDAWEHIDTIKKSFSTLAQEKLLTKKDTLVMVSMGSAAKVFVYDLTKEGYTAWDTGQFFDLAFQEIKKITT
jgi:hypothetical protein